MIIYLMVIYDHFDDYDNDNVDYLNYHNYDNRNKMIIFMILQNNNFNYEHLLEHQDKYHNQEITMNIIREMMKKMIMIKIRRRIRIYR